MQEVTQKQAPPKITWKAPEHRHSGDKSQDWFWALGFVAISIAIASILLGNVLFGLLILLASVTLGLSANQKPHIQTYTITTRGIAINKILYPYKNLETFWIDETAPHRTTLIIDAQRSLMPHLIIDLPETVNVDEVQDYLLDYLPEEELFEPASHRIAHILGF